MSFVQSCKNAACGIVSCCDRRSSFNPEQPPRSYNRHSEINASSKHYFSRLRTWPKDSQGTRQSRVNGNRTAVSGRGQQLHNTADTEAEKLTENIRQRVFTYDIVLLGNEPIYRRLLLDFNLNIDAISDEIPTLMNLPITPYDGLEVPLPSGALAKPIGIVKLKWRVYKKKRKFETTFLVIPNNHFDMLIGRSSIQTHKLWDADRDIRKRLQYD
ncbi:uncharacterized protein BDV14DRAFT_93693 [Aspergillus stella-maris]|uniref:uncharacterized protein n=1 Tax=Aspergillus stella-maris TaxID=1810926 RepID=UPI003CCC94DB